MNLAGGAGFEPATPGSGGLCPVLARHRERLDVLHTRPYPPGIADISKLELTSILQLPVEKRYFLARYLSCVIGQEVTPMSRGSSLNLFSKIDM